MIVVEDFVGSGKQTFRILQAIREATPDDCRILFVPLVILDTGREKLLNELDEWIGKREQQRLEEGKWSAESQGAGPTCGLGIYFFERE